MKSARSQSNEVLQTTIEFILWALNPSSAEVFEGLAASPCCGGSWSSGVWGGRRGVKRMQNQDGAQWGFLFSLTLQLAPVCNKYCSYISFSHRNQKCHEPAPPQLQTILCSVWASLVLCDSKPSRPVPSPCSEVRGSLGIVCRASQISVLSRACSGVGVVLFSWPKDVEGRGDGALDPVMLILYLWTSCYSYSIDSLPTILMVMKYWLHFGNESLMGIKWWFGVGSDWMSLLRMWCNLGRGDVHALR